MSRDHYPAKTKVIKVGTGPAEAPAVNLSPEAINESVNTQNQENTIIDSIFGGR